MISKDSFAASNHDNKKIYLKGENINGKKVAIYKKSTSQNDSDSLTDQKF